MEGKCLNSIKLGADWDTHWVEDSTRFTIQKTDTITDMTILTLSYILKKGWYCVYKIYS